MTYKLFIDDEREPEDVTWLRYKSYDNSDYIVARSYDEVFALIDDLGFPEFISFDHDLGSGEKTGYDIVQGIIECDLDFGVIPDNFEFEVHSMNPVGKKNIEGTLTRYLDWKEKS